jgi:hypothetical protein
MTSGEEPGFRECLCDPRVDYEVMLLSHSHFKMLKRIEQTISVDFKKHCSRCFNAYMYR